MRFLDPRQLRALSFALALAIPITLAACNASASTPAPQPAAPTSQPTSVPPTQAPPTQPPSQPPAPTVAVAAPTITRPAAPSATPNTPSAAAPTQAPAAQPSPTTAATKAIVAPKLNLNTATREEFLKVPNVGDRMVREFFEYRPYVSIQQFRREIGKYVNAQQVADYEKFVYVPIDINKSDAETLQQIPGVDKTFSGLLIAGRPYSSTDAFLKALAQQLGNDALSIAQSYLVAP